MSAQLRSKIRRFFFVRARGPRASVMHRVYKTRYEPVEGDMTACGVVISKTWQWITPLMRKLPKCKRCEHATG